MFKTTGTIVIITILTFLGVVAGVTGAQESKPPGTGPRDGVPLCEEHLDTLWHPLYNDNQDCHHDHQHGMNPNTPQLVAIFGHTNDVVGQEISYPWQTYNDDGMSENEMKHRAYQWQTFAADEGECVVSRTDLGTSICAFRVQYHADWGELGFTAVEHSFWVEVQVCDLSGENCELIRTGGHADTGCGFVPYNGLLTVVADEQVCPDGGKWSTRNPYRTNKAIRQLPRARKFAAPNHPTMLWNYVQGDGIVQRLVIRNVDGWGAVDRRGVNDWTFEWGFPDFQGHLNGSRTHVSDFDFVPNAPKTVDGVPAFTDVDGRLDASCTAITPNCVPYENTTETSKRIRYAWTVKRLPNGDYPRDRWWSFYEGDQSPGQIGTGSEWWIVPTDFGGDDPHPTPTPQPTVTPCPCECGN